MEMIKQKKENIFIRATNFIEDNKVATILIMCSIILGLFIGSYATTSGIEGGYWEVEGYYYIEPSSEEVRFTNDSTAYGMTTYTPDYSESAYIKATPSINKSKIIIFECYNSTLKLNDNQIACIK